MFWKKTKTYHDSDIIEGFRNPDPRVVDYVYSQYYKVIENYIVKHGGLKEDVKDIFQEGLSVVFLKVQKEDFRLECAFGTYLFSVCKNIWLVLLREKKHTVELASQWEQEETEDDRKAMEIEILQQRKEHLFRKHYAELDEECQQIMRLYLKKIPFKEVADILGLPSEMHAVKRKARCKEILIKKVKDDPEYKVLY